MLSAVQKAIKDARVTAIKRHASGRLEAVDQELADQQWALNTDPAQALKNGKTTAVPPAAPAAGAALGGDQLQLDPPVEGAPAPKPGEDPHGYLKERAERERINRQLTELDYLERVGLLVSKEDVRKAQFEIFRELRDNLLLIGPRVSQRFAAETDPLRIEQQLNEQLRQVLDELSRSLAVEPAGGVADRAAAVS